MRITKALSFIGLLAVHCHAEKQSCNVNVRLPTSLNPLHYELKLKPTLSGNFTVYGKVSLDFEVVETTDSITLHSSGIKVDNKTVKVEDMDSGLEYKVLSQIYDEEREFFIVELHQRMQAGKQYKISMLFSTTLNDKPTGFYRSSYVTEDGKTSWMASTHFQPTHTRKSFPCMDEPGFRTTFDITICRDKDLTSLSNMPLLRSVPITSTRLVCDHFERSVSMATYLVAYVVSDYKPTVIPTPEGTAEIKVWTRPEVMDKAQYSGEISKKCLNFYEDFFNIKYPLPKLDLIAPQDFAGGAMENWGLITYQEPRLLFDNASSASHLQAVSYINCHELAHQWFGNLVTPKWWNDLWLNEGFATYIGMYALSKVAPYLGTMTNFVVGTLQKSMALDALSSSHPISVVVRDPAEISELFDHISYKKGASVIRMMDDFLTHETFVSGLKDYLTKHKFGNTEQDDLWLAMDAATRRLSPHRLPDGLTVKEIMDTWTLKKGFPVLTVKRNYSPNNLLANISQEKFSFNTSSAKNSTKLWWIPITESRKDQKFSDEPRLTWFGKKEGQLDDMPHEDSWLIINVQQTGYYRVNYDERNWDLISQQLQQNHTVIDVRNRAQIIDDALNLARAGLLPYGSALKVTSYLRFERNVVPWKAAMTGFSYLMDMLRHTPNYGPLKEYLRSLIKPIYNYLGLEDKQDDTPHTKELRERVFSLACSLGHKDCLKEAKKIYNKWKADTERFKVPSSLVESVFCTAMRSANRDEWEWAWEKYVLETDQTWRGAMVRGFGCSKEIWVLQRYLSMAFDKTQKSGVKAQDIYKVVGGIAESPVGDMVAWNYFKNNWDHINEYIGTIPFILPKMVKDVTKQLNTKAHLSEIKELHSRNKQATAKTALAQAVEATEYNRQWMEDNYIPIVTWLRGKGFSSTLPTIEALKEKDECDDI